MHDESLYAERLLRAGGRGYIMKSEGGKKLVAAIRHVLAGGHRRERTKTFETGRRSALLEAHEAARSTTPDSPGICA